MIKHIKDIPIETVTAGEKAFKQVLIGHDQAPHFALRRFVVKGGGRIPVHTNTVEHEQFVLAGRAEIGIEDKVYTVEKHNVVFIPARVPHWYKVLGEEDFEFLCIVPNQTDNMVLLERK